MRQRSLEFLESRLERASRAYAKDPEKSAFLSSALTAIGDGDFVSYASFAMNDTLRILSPTLKGPDRKVEYP